MDTEYTKGFKAGMAWREAEIIKLLEEHLGFDYEVGIYDPESNCQLNPDHIIALVKGEEQVSEKRKIQPDPNPYIKWWL